MELNLAQLPERFRSKVVVDDSGCWLWCTSLKESGYGLYSTGNSSVSAHRYSYELLVGAVPMGLELDHLCRVRRCVNPVHLEAVTHAENVRRSNEALGRGPYATHCSAGHDFTPSNTYVDPGNNGRCCRLCRRETRRRYRERRRATAP